MDLVSLVAVLLVFALIWWLITELGLPQPVRMVAAVAMALVLLLWLLGGVSVPHLVVR